MEANNLNISEQDRNSILNHIISCANSALQSEDAFQKSMHELADELRRVFDSEYCSIGIVIDEYAEDCVISYKKFEDEELSKQQERFFKSFNRASIDDDKFIVCQALKSDTDIFLHEEKIDRYINNEYYQSILTSRHVKNSYVIHLRDKEKKNFGFIQFINTKKGIDYERDITPYSDALLGLVQNIINNRKNHQELVKTHNLLKDADFYNLMQDKRDNVDELLDSIMNYFSYEFNAAVISFRMPVLNGYKREPLFYLRDIFVHPSIGDKKCTNLKKNYFSERLVKNNNEINDVDKLKCSDQGTILESKSKTDFSKYDLDLDNNTLIIPIFRDFGKCVLPLQTSFAYCKDGEHLHCEERFKRLYGLFRLRICKTNLSNRDFIFNLEETKLRIAYLSKQITLLFNSIVDKHENESLQIFQNELKNSSFIKIKDFDERCVNIIIKSTNAKICSIYRYDDRTKSLKLSASTAKIIKFNTSGQTLYIKTQQIKDSSCFIHIKDKNNLLARAYQQKQCEYVLNVFDTTIHQSPFIEFIKSETGQETAMAIPMIKKDGTCAGVVLLLGKENHKHSISTAYWEHDVSHIEFIVNMLTRMSESDTERLTFLSQLSHEMLAPVTQLVNDNDLILNIAERNFDSITKRQLVEKIRENIDRNMLFKYIIDDTEFIYSSTGRSIDYNIVKQNKPQAILLDAIRLLEKEAHEAKGLSIITYISEMPPLYFDKERMMQVFLNLIKNAIRYADRHTEIRISYNKRNDGFHEISFADVGIGVQEKEKDTIFELFHRGVKATEIAPRGTGMGLYIVRDIMRAHGGDCQVRRLDNPTEFAITLPDKE